MVQSSATPFNRVEEENKMLIQSQEANISQFTKEETKKKNKKVKEEYFRLT